MHKDSKETYTVLIYRKDSAEPMLVFESDDFTACKTRWKELHEQWKLSHQEATPFVLEKPVVTAFEPGIIAEISVKPKMAMLQQVEDDNPYKQMMMQKGFSQSLQGVDNNFKGTVNGSNQSDLLDNGFK